MFSQNEYELVDFGDARKLERFGAYLVDRPCPAAEPLRRDKPNLWRSAAARFSGRPGQAGRWRTDATMPEQWTISYHHITFELQPTRVGQLGIFPEQAACWDWIAAQVAHAKQMRQQSTDAHALSDVPKVLNLFAYTGGSTLAAAAGGAQVVHIDAAKSSVSRARTNAGLSQLAAAPIRWIVEDAVRFTTRELRRGNRYDAVILDPPSYGHGPQGQVWKLAEDLPKLLKLCGQLTADRLAFVLLTCHTPGYGPDTLADHLASAALCGPSASIDAGPLTLTTAAGRTLPSGYFARWSRSPRAT
jgi:23S rRNA (cytosine1962-C5)-methyltransferase